MKTILIALIILLFNSTLFGQSNSSNTTDTGVHQHDGFFLRFVGGCGYTEWTKELNGEDDKKISGLGVSFREQIGLTLDDNLILCVDVGFVTVGKGGEVSKGNSTSSLVEPESNIDFGLGLNYYFMPNNIYASLSILSSVSTLENYYGESTFGLGINLLVGKEWWVSDNWGIGGAMYLYYRTNDTGNTDLNSFSIGLMLSATYN